jgi:hypothetical protein
MLCLLSSKILLNEICQKTDELQTLKSDVVYVSIPYFPAY